MLRYECVLAEETKSGQEEITNSMKPRTHEDACSSLQTPCRPDLHVKWRHPVPAVIRPDAAQQSTQGRRTASPYYYAPCCHASQQAEQATTSPALCATRTQAARLAPSGITRQISLWPCCLLPTYITSATSCPSPYMQWHASQLWLLPYLWHAILRNAILWHHPLLTSHLHLKGSEIRCHQCDESDST